VVRDIIIGPTKPLHRAAFAYRSVYQRSFDAERESPLPHQMVGRGSPHRDLLHDKDRKPALLRDQRAGAGDWMTKESWSAKGDVTSCAQLCRFPSRGADGARCLSRLPQMGNPERDPLPTWSQGRIVLIGDACHPMTPYMAQGAATSIEDAAVLARCLRTCGEGIEAAFKRFEAHRKPRTSKIQEISSANTWMSGGNDDPSWLLWLRRLNVSLDEPAPAPGSPGNRPRHERCCDVFRRQLHRAGWSFDRLYRCTRLRGLSHRTADRADSISLRSTRAFGMAWCRY